MGYIHMRPPHEAPVQEQLSDHLPIEGLVMQQRRRAPRAGDVTIDGKTDGTAPPIGSETFSKSRSVS